MEELPDLSDAEKVMDKYRLDDDAKSKLREIIEKRAEDKDEILVKIKKHLDNCANPSSMLCSWARFKVNPTCARQGYPNGSVDTLDSAVVVHCHIAL